MNVIEIFGRRLIIVEDINELQPHKVSEVICIKCTRRWLAVRPVETFLKDLECPYCLNRGFIIETGETNQYKKKINMDLKLINR